MPTAPDTLVIPFTFYGQACEMDAATDPEVILVGPAGTGKTRCNLEKLHRLCGMYPNVRALIVRKTLASLKGSALVTFDEKVNPFLDGVRFIGDTAKRPAHYLYPNGSVIVIGGMDKPTKVMSAEYDLVYVVEATELDERDWEALTTRLRNGRLPFQQIMGDCNADGPDHWLRKRMDGNKTRELLSYHEDNPVLYHRASQQWTAEGLRYLSVLDNLSGVRYARLRLNQWVAAEGMIYQDAWDRGHNLIDRFDIPLDWPRYLSIDFGYSNPFVCQWWAEDPDGRLYLYREIYYTNRLVEDHAADIVRLSGWELDAKDKRREPFPRAIICDHDAEGRATLEKRLVVSGRRLVTTAAQKTVADGIQAVASRMRPAGDHKPRLFILRDCVVQRDPLLVEKKLPTCTLEEIESYVWDANKEKPVKANDHGMDPLRYVVMHKDGKSHTITRFPNPLARG